jgi:DNA-directed RNA polymerase II subunit RPB1
MVDRSAGFLIKVKKILESICVNCGRLKADIVSYHKPVIYSLDQPAHIFQSDPAFAEKIRHIRDPKKRMAVVWSHCKTKMVCEPDDPKEEGEGGEREEGDGAYNATKKGHGGCGHIQPLIRKEALKLVVQYKKQKDDDEVRKLSHLVAPLTNRDRHVGSEVDTTG